MPRRPPRKKDIGDYRHDDKRTNIPTSQTQQFMTEENRDLEPVFYNRNKDLDPQLMWHGKDEENQEELMVDAPPIYIQEKIEPRAIIEGLKQHSHDADGAPSLFEEFNGLEFEKTVDFYEHDVNWANRLILGDSLQVMSSLAERECYRGQVKMIYMDPPYGIKFNSNWQVTTNNAGRGKTSRQPEQIRAFRDTWRLGIHSYLSYLRDRLIVGHDLLMDSGSIFVQIGEENVHLVRSLFDEVFGRENFVRQIQVHVANAQESDLITRVCDYILWYAKDQEYLQPKMLWIEKTEEQLADFDKVELADGRRMEYNLEQLKESGVDLEGSRRFSSFTSIQARGTTTLTGTDREQKVIIQGQERKLRPGFRWKASYPEGLARVVLSNRIHLTDNSERFIAYMDERLNTKLHNLWLGFNYGGRKRYVVSTIPKIIGRCILMSTDPGDLVLDPTCGGGTTAFAAEKWGRRWITIDTSRVAISVTRKRLMSSKYDFYILQDSKAGYQIEQEHDNVPPAEDQVFHNRISRGFVYKYQTRVTMKDISTNEEIHEGLTKEELEKVIYKNATKDILYDQPHIDRKIVRVSGRFTVESLSPYRFKDPGEVSGEDPIGPSGNGSPTGPDDNGSPTDSGFVERILENMDKSGVQNTAREERINFNEIDYRPGPKIQATGTYQEETGKVVRAAISIGPQYGTVGKRHINEAALEAKQGEGHDLLLVCAFSFEADVEEHTKQIGSLKIMNVRINTDLMMGDSLKPDANANLFTVFGEPDIEVRQVEHEKWKEALQVKLLGLDIYDPNTGQVRVTDLNEIACWFIDTEYNGEAFYVRHAYFTGGDKNYRQLERALRAEIDKEAWLSLYKTESLPFPKPKTNKIAVKVINHYGDEVLKVYDIVKLTEENFAKPNGLN